MLNLSNQEILANSGLKNTVKRNLILDILKEKGCLTAEEIFQLSKKVDPRINLSTIYRTLNSFVAKGIARKSNLAQADKARFKLNDPDHLHYLTCLTCDKKVSLDDCPLGGYDLLLADQTNFAIVGHKLAVYGYCPNCQAAM